MNYLICLVLILFAIFQNTKSWTNNLNCSIDNIGNFDCDIITGYSTKQWVRCVSRETYNKYITPGDTDPWLCRKNYCTLTCMVEYYGIKLTKVYRDCECNRTDIGGKHNRSKIIDDECYQPNGEDCSWYRNCLAKRYDCNLQYATVEPNGIPIPLPWTGNNNYAIDYGEKFCKLYDESYGKFSKEGQEWVNNVRKCLQNELALHVRPWSDSNCEEIEKIAFDSHTPCYLHPGGEKGFCSLGIKDQLKVFFTIKGAFLSTFPESIKGSFGVLDSCLGPIINQYVETIIYYNMYQLNFNYVAKNSLMIDSNKLSVKLSNKLDVNQTNVDIYVQINVNDTLFNNINARIMITNLANVFNNETDLSILTEIDIKLNEMFLLGKLDLDLEDNVSISPSSIQKCQSFDCKSINMSLSAVHTIHAVQKEEKHNAKNNVTISIYVVTSLCVIALGFGFYFMYRKYKIKTALEYGSSTVNYKSFFNQ